MTGPLVTFASFTAFVVYPFLEAMDDVMILTFLRLSRSADVLRDLVFVVVPALLRGDPVPDIGLTDYLNFMSTIHHHDPVSWSFILEFLFVMLVISIFRSIPRVEEDEAAK